jgi:hypothetical protein
VRTSYLVGSFACCAKYYTRRPTYMHMYVHTYVGSHIEARMLTYIHRCRNVHNVVLVCSVTIFHARHDVFLLRPTKKANIDNWNQSEEQNDRPARYAVIRRRRSINCVQVGDVETRKDCSNADLTKRSLAEVRRVKSCGWFLFLQCWHFKFSDVKLCYLRDTCRRSSIFRADICKASVNKNAEEP